MTTTSFAINADWVSPPGSTLEDFLVEQERSTSEFADKLQCTVSFLRKLIKGSAEIDKDLANKLEVATGASSSFWLEREAQYRECIEKLQDREELEQEWLTNLPTADMARFGWIEKLTNRKEKLLACLDYFDVLSVDEWQLKYSGMLSETAFRTSSTFSSKLESVTAWLRQGELEAGGIDCARWDKEKLENAVPHLRELTNIPDPSDFIPPLVEILASCGVALTVIQSPKGCSASGATYWLNEDKALLMLSVRYLSDDHFWFTFFHELGHLILHSDHSLILESNDDTDSEIEREANQFAEDVLVPKEFKAELSTLNSKDLRKILKFSKKVGVSKGIIVGQMQHKSIVPRNHLNKLKQRYSW